MQRICQHCRKGFAHTGNTRGKFCSPACYHEYRKTNQHEYRKVRYIALTCGHCGKSFERRAQEVRGAVQYCSRECAGTVSGGRVHRVKRKPSVTKHCEQCNQPYKTPASRADRRRFCSKPCELEYRSLHMTGKNNPNYRHGRNQSSAKYTALRHYAQVCALCGWDIAIEVHHIQPKHVDGNNDADNLVVLCPNHHRMAEMGLIEQGELVKAALAARLSE